MWSQPERNLRALDSDCWGVAFVEPGQLHSGTVLNAWDYPDQVESMLSFWQLPKDAFTVLIQEVWTFIDGGAEAPTDMCQVCQHAPGNHKPHMEVKRRHSILFYLNHHLSPDTRVRRSADGSESTLGAILARGRGLPA